MKSSRPGSFVRWARWTNGQDNRPVRGKTGPGAQVAVLPDFSSAAAAPGFMRGRFFVIECLSVFGAAARKPRPCGYADMAGAPQGASADPPQSGWRRGREPPARQCPDDAGPSSPSRPLWRAASDSPAYRAAGCGVSRSLAGPIPRRRTPQSGRRTPAVSLWRILEAVGAW